MGRLYEFCCSRLKRTYLAALNEKESSELSRQNRGSLLKQLSYPLIYKESPHKGLIILTFGRHHSETKIAEEEPGSNPHSFTAATVVPQENKAWSGHKQSYSSGARELEEKLRNRNTSSSKIWTSTQRLNWKISNHLDDR